MKTQLFEKKVNVVHNWHAIDRFSPALSDEAFWGDNPRYYSTIKPIAFNNDLYLIARDKRGLVTWKFEKALNKWEVLDEFFPPFTDETIWNKPEYYSTIKTIVFNNELFLIARGKRGLMTWVFNKNTEKWMREPIDEFFPPFTDELLWNKPEYYTTIKPFTFNNELFLMARLKEGMVTYMFDKKLRKWMREPIDKLLPIFSDKLEWNRPEFYSTIKPVVVNNELFLIAHGIKGLITYMFDKKSNVWFKEPVDEFFTIFDAGTEWFKPEYYSTLRTVIHNDILFLMVRDKKGMLCFLFNSETKKWNREPIDKFFPELSDEKMWNRPEYYTTIKPVVANNKLFLLARDKGGMITWVFDNKLNRWNREPVDEFFPEFSDKLEWNKIEYYSTIAPGVVNDKFVILARDKKGMLTYKFDMPSN